MIELLTITSDREQCGIREHGNHLQQHLPNDITMRGNGRGEWLDPAVFFRELPSMTQSPGPHVVWINHHSALHSRWTGAQIMRLRDALPVLVSYHDSGVPNSAQCHEVYKGTTDPAEYRGAFIVHEPCPDLPNAIYLRQGVPDWQPPYQALHGPTTGVPPDDLPSFLYWIGLGHRPILGTVGFPFPWKCYDLLAKATALAGWSLLLLAPDQYHGGKPDQLASDIAGWQALNPWTAVVSDFLPAEEVVRYLGMCDATAFLYMCANTGTSGAIRQGIAARKPVLATAGCRQMRDLQEDGLGGDAIRWLHDLSPEGVAVALHTTVITRVDPAIHRLAERDSWRNQAQRYAEVIRRLVA